jgi:hypothetical protein
MVECVLAARNPLSMVYQIFFRKKSDNVFAKQLSKQLDFKTDANTTKLFTVVTNTAPF